MARPSKRDQKSFEWRSLFEGRRKWFTITPACLLLIGAGWWAYVKLTVLPPVEASKAPVEEVANFLTSDRGLIQMPVDQRQQYLVRTWQYYAQSTPAQRERVTQTLARLPPSQKRVLADAVAGVVKDHVMKGAREYNRLKSPAQQSQFAQKFYGDFQRMRTELVGGGTMAPGMNVAMGVKGVTPETPQEMQSSVYNNSTPSERAQAEPLIDKMVDIHKSEIQQRVRG